MNANVIMELVDELVRVTRDLTKLQMHHTHGPDQGKQELGQRSGDILEKLQAFADEHERLTFLSRLKASRPQHEKLRNMKLTASLV